MGSKVQYKDSSYANSRGGFIPVPRWGECYEGGGGGGERGLKVEVNGESLDKGVHIKERLVVKSLRKNTAQILKGLKENWIFLIKQLFYCCKGVS